MADIETIFNHFLTKYDEKVPYSNRLKNKARENELELLESFYARAKELINSKYGDIEVLDKDELERVQKRRKVMNKKKPVPSVEELNGIKLFATFDKFVPTIEELEGVKLTPIPQDFIGMNNPHFMEWLKEEQEKQLVQMEQIKAKLAEHQRELFMVYSFVLAFFVVLFIGIFYPYALQAKDYVNVYALSNQTNVYALQAKDYVNVYALQAKDYAYQFAHQANETFYRNKPKVVEWYITNREKADRYFEQYFDNTLIQIKKFVNR